MKMNNEEYNVQEKTENVKKKKVTKTEKIIFLILTIMITIPFFDFFFIIQQGITTELTYKYLISFFKLCLFAILMPQVIGRNLTLVNKIKNNSRITVMNIIFVVIFDIIGIALLYLYISLIKDLFF